LDDRVANGLPVMQSDYVEPTLERFETPLYLEVALGLCDREEPQQMDVARLPTEKLEFGAKRVRAGDEKVVERRPGNPRLSNRG
jgi:hypothetical protein